MFSIQLKMKFIISYLILTQDNVDPDACNHMACDVQMCYRPDM